MRVISGEARWTIKHRCIGGEVNTLGIHIDFQHRRIHGTPWTPPAASVVGKAFATLCDLRAIRALRRGFRALAAVALQFPRAVNTLALAFASITKKAWFALCCTQVLRRPGGTLYALRSRRITNEESFSGVELGRLASVDTAGEVVKDGSAGTDGHLQ